MISERFGKWTVINDDTKDNKGRTLYTVKCDCGTIKTTKKDTLTSGKSTQCLKCFCNRGNIYKIGDKIHNWTILEEGKNKWMERHYLCKCECGKEKIVRKRDLERNKSTRCVSCWISQKNTTHNNSTSATYRIWLKWVIMKKIKITFYISLEDYALLKAFMIKRIQNHRLPKQSDIICEAIREIAK